MVGHVVVNQIWRFVGLPVSAHPDLPRTKQNRFSTPRTPPASALPRTKGAFMKAPCLNSGICTELEHSIQDIVGSISSEIVMTCLKPPDRQTAWIGGTGRASARPMTPAPPAWSVRSAPGTMLPRSASDPASSPRRASETAARRGSARKVERSGRYIVQCCFLPSRVVSEPEAPAVPEPRAPTKPKRL